MKITLRQSDVLISIEKGRRMDIAGSTTRLRQEGGGWAIDPDTGEERWFDAADLAFIAGSAEPTNFIQEIPGGGGTYDTQTGEVVTYDPVLSTPFQQFNQIYPTIESSQIVENGPWVANGEVYSSFESAQAAITGNAGLVKRPGELITASVEMDISGVADLTGELQVGPASRATEFNSTVGANTVQISVSAPSAQGTYSAVVRVRWLNELLASATADQLIEVI